MAAAINLFFMCDVLCWRFCSTSELHVLESGGIGADLAALGIARRNEPLVGEIAFLAERLVAHVLGDEFLDAWDHADVRLLHVDEERTRRQVFAGSDALEHRA